MKPKEKPMRNTFLGAVAGLVLATLPALGGTVDKDLKTAVSLMGELQACLAGGLGSGGITPSPEDMAAVRTILHQADPLLRQADALSHNTNLSPQDEMLLAAWTEGSLAMLNIAEEYRLERGY